MTSVHLPTPLLGGLSPQAFMRRVWQRRPWLVRQAWPGVRPPLRRTELFALAAREGVESRLVQRDVEAATPRGRGRGRGIGNESAAARADAAAQGWQVRHGPFARRALPPLDRPNWTLLVQGLDLHVPVAHEMLAPFRFVPAARLDDLMVSWASPGGGVGPHSDSYDVFLLQVQGRRRWRVAPPQPPQPSGESAFVEGLPVKILRRFEPVHDWVLEPGDMLYLPPLWGHDGVAEGGDCMTCSVGFRSPSGPELAREMLQRLADEAGDEAQDGTAPLYADASQPATATPGLVPEALQRFAARAVAQVLRDPLALPRTLGETLSEPKPQVWFEAGAEVPAAAALRLDARTRMLYDDRHVFINGESYRASGRDAGLLRRLADTRVLSAAEAARLSSGARACVQQWAEDGWVRAEDAST